MSNQEFDFERKLFSHTNKVDLTSFDPCDNLEHIAAIAEEHAFRGISVPLFRVPDLVKIKQESKWANFKIIAHVDFPFGFNPRYIRKAMCVYAGESGADEVEICTPYNLVKQKNTSEIHKDIKDMITVCRKLDILPRIAIDTGDSFFPNAEADGSKDRFGKILQANRIENIVFYNSPGYSSDINHGSNIIEMRNVRPGSYCTMKAQLRGIDLETLSMYPKAGAKLLGLPWKEACGLVHGYEDIVQAQRDKDSEK